MPLPGSIPPDLPEPKTEAELRERLDLLSAGERRLRDLMNADPFAILIGDLAGGITYMNPPLREILGYSAAQIERGEVRWDALTPSEFKERDRRAQQELTEHGRCRLYEKEFIAHDGRRVPVLIGASMISNGDEVVAFIADLSELQHMQQEIRDRDTSIAISDERSRQLLRANPFGILISKADGTVGYANPPLLEMLGYTPDDLEAGRLNWQRITPPEFLQRSMDALHEIYANGSCPAYEKEYIARDGRRVPVLIGSALIPNLEGGKDIASFVTDLTELKQTQKDLEESRRELERSYAEIETVYRTAPIGLAFFDPKEFRYLRLNDEQAKIIGKPKDEIVGRTLTEIAPIKGLRELFESVADGKPIANFLLEGALPNRPGEQRAWTVNYYPVVSENGQLQGITAASLEVTDLKRTESALHESEKLAAVGRLASSISHEINNPLEAITNLLYLARHETDDAKRNYYLETAEHEVGRVSQIATQTLRFHRQPGKPIPLTARDLVEPVLALYAGRLTNSNIHIERRYRSAAPFACMEGDMRQVLNNLVGNAIDAMRTGGTLTIRSSDVTNPKTGEQRVRITVADTGYGMNQETKNRLFEAFYTTKGIAGTGLGMWISKGILDKQGSAISLYSSQHAARHGTVFALSLPLECPPLGVEKATPLGTA